MIHEREISSVGGGEHVCLGRAQTDVGSVLEGFCEVDMNLEAEMAAGPQCAASFPYQESSILRKAYTAGLRDDTKPKCLFSYHAQAGQLRGVAKNGFLS